MYVCIKWHVCCIYGVISRTVTVYICIELVIIIIIIIIITYNTDIHTVYYYYCDIKSNQFWLRDTWSCISHYPTIHVICVHMSKLSVASSVLKLHRFIMEQEKVEHFLQKPDFRDPFFKYNDCRNWVSILSDKKVIRVAELSAIQSKPTSEEANIYLHTLLLRDPSFDKLRILSQALGEDETHRNQKKLSDTIVNFLETENAGKFQTMIIFRFYILIL